MSYDMASWPHRGDALDHINESTPAVLAFHLFGIKKGQDYSLQSLEADYFYNRENENLLPLCRSLGVPLYVFGDQPEGPPALFRAYR